MTISIFQEVKNCLTTRQVAESYGLKVSRNGMCRCIFHDDHTPSMKVDKRYYCFGCGATGDVIDFAGKLLGLAPYDAAKKLADDFGIDAAGSITVAPKKIAVEKERYPFCSQFKKDKTKTLHALNDYHTLLKDWRVRYAPNSPEDKSHDCFVTSLQMESCIEHYLDVLLLGVLGERVELVDLLKQFIPDLQSQIDRFHEEYGYPERDLPKTAVALKDERCL